MKQLPWKPVPGYEGLYLINRRGEIKSLQKASGLYTMQQRIDRAGYYTVKLSKKRKDSTQYVHRLLALAFIPNPNNLPYVNHKNGDKLDNRLFNLEWTDASGNMIHAFQIGLLVPGKKAVVDTCTGERFESIKVAAVTREIRYDKLKGYLNGLLPNPTCLQYQSKVIGIAPTNAEAA